MKIIANKTVSKKIEGKKPSKKVFHVEGWSHVLIEGYCMVNQEYDQKSSKYIYKFDADKKMEDWEKEPNPEYDPTVKPVNKPAWCKGHVCIACLNAGNMCEHFNYGDVEPELRKKFQKIVHEEYDSKPVIKK